MSFHPFATPCAVLLLASVAVAQTPELADPIAPAEMAAPMAEAEAVESNEGPVGTTLLAPSAPVPVVVAPTPAVAYAPVLPGPVCCPIEVIDYRTTHAAKRAYRCGGAPINTVVCVENPADCRPYGVVFCVPGCCLGEPRVCNTRVGLLGRGYAEVVWPSGFTATVVFRVHGGAIVVYEG